MRKEIGYLLRLYFLMEWRSRFMMGGLLLYVIATVFTAYLCFRQAMDIPVWNAFFWITVLFVSVNTAAKSFIQESRDRLLYYYTLASAEAVILSRIAYHVILLFFLSLVCRIVFGLLLTDPVEDNLLFFVVILLGSSGFATVMTLISAIASKSSGSGATMMAILGFPLLFPLLITIIRVSKNAMDGLSWSVSWKYVLMLLALNTIVTALSYVLFPYLWRD